MGDIADLMLNGTLCQECGSLMGDLVQIGTKVLKEAPGHPRTCKECKPTRKPKKIKRNG